MPVCYSSYHHGAATALIRAALHCGSEHELVILDVHEQMLTPDAIIWGICSSEQEHVAMGPS